MTAVHELGYRPDLLAQGLRGRRTWSVGFTLSDIANPVLAETVLGAERELRNAGYSLLLTQSEGAADLDALHIHALEQRRVDGYLLSLVDEHHPETRAVLQELDVPIVLLDRDLPDGVSASRACFDHGAGMRDAANHLLALGHRHVALITGGPRRPARQRQEGIEEAFSAHGGGAVCTVYAGELSVDYGSQATLEILKSTPRPTAIIAGGNMIMHGSLRALRRAGVRVGQDVSFVGCDDVAVAELHDPPIAVVRRDNRLLGEEAARLLLAQFNSEEATDGLVLPTEFIPRPSCAPVYTGA